MLILFLYIVSAVLCYGHLFAYYEAEGSQGTAASRTAAAYMALFGPVGLTAALVITRGRHGMRFR